MGTVVFYPVQVTGYEVSVGRNSAEIHLEGVEGPFQESGASSGNTRRVGRITFGDPNPRDFINRGGFLEMGRPLEMFSGILDLLRNETPLFLMVTAR
jgi:hypothetical protein